MKVALITPVYPPYRGGIGGVAAADAQRLQSRGVAVQVFTPDYGRERSPDTCVQYVQPFFAQGNAALLPALFRKLKGFSMIHLQYPFYGADLFVWLVHVVRRTPYVVTYHMRATAKDYRQIIFSFHKWFFEPFFLYFAKAVIVSSHDYAKSVGLRHKNIVEIPFGVDTERFSPGTDSDFRARYRIPEQVPVILFVGGLDHAHFFKGVEVLLKAVQRFSRERDWRVMIVGEGDLHSRYEAEARALGIADRILFTGALSTEDLPRAYRAADVHVLPSIAQNEAFGLVTLEAAASGIPSVVSDLPGVRTVIEPGVTGFLAKPGDPQGLARVLERLLQEEKLRQDLGRNARERAVTVYAEQRLAEQLLFVYNS